MRQRGSEEKLLTEDRTSCEVHGVIMQDRRFWEPDTVLQLGGVKQSSPRSHNLLPHKPFKGCLCNVVLNKQVYDLAAPLEAVNSSPGCARKGTACSSPAPCDSPCVSDPRTPSCDCPPAHQERGKAAYIQQALSCDSLKVYHMEGDGSPAGSLSTLASSGAEGDVEYEEEMRRWGPKFVTLSKLYSYTAAEDLQ
ncbi:putative neural-cadherin 2 isoform X2 [Spea bombifrons]|uniref:putative neural-cadherin 2 isoform X2 n=1 Tax=Spea bombifrons TaxID=233779 RepID=UPI00234945EE|nr:putative neural-cadherin 2 isoform X2 [Spea bombifrons]